MLNMSIYKNKQLHSKNRCILRKTTSNGVHFIGIGGIGVSALAQYYLAQGDEVSGSDLVSSEITNFLRKKGAKIYIGPHKRKCLTSGVKQVIYSPAVKLSNPELKKAYKLKSNIQYPISNIQIKSYPEALGELTKKYFTIAVCGTHGKSTTTAMISLILIKAGLNPTVILGTKLKEFGNTNFRMGNFPKHKIQDTKCPLFAHSKILIIEADEWQASFLKYFPKIIVLTSIEREHLDYYKNLEHILKTYQKFIGLLPKDGNLVVNKDDPNVQKVCRGRTSASLVCRGRTSASFYSLKQKEAKKLRKILKVPGEHNVSNALAALSTARVLKIPDKVSFEALSEYQGAWRRFEIVEADKRGYQPRRRTFGSLRGRRGLTRKITIISDYAHHPTEIKATLKAAREKFPNKKIWCVFQPHQYQRTYYLFQGFVKIFTGALEQKQINKLIITDIYDVAGRENKKIKEEVNSKKMIEAINKKSGLSSFGVGVYLPKEEILKYLKKSLEGREVVIIMGAGDIYKLGEPTT